MHDDPLFSVSQFTTWHNSHEEDLQLYADLGIPAVEVCERKLSTHPREASDQLELVKQHGLSVTSVQPRCHAMFPDSMCPDIASPDERQACFRNTIDLFTKVFPDQQLPFVTITGNAPQGDFAHAYRTARRHYSELASYAADRGARIMFEPLNPVLMNRDTFICTLEEAIRLVEDVNQFNFGLMIDVWHVWREPDIANRLGQLGDRIFGVHISDWPADEPRHVGDRLLPGDGVIDLAKLLSAIHGTGYRGAYCLEIFSVDHLPDSLWQLDPRDVLKRGKQGFLSAWNQQATN